MAFVRKFIYFGGAAIDLAKIIIVLAVILSLVHYFIGTIFVVSGESMMPNFEDGQIVWSNKIGYITGNPDRGDSVVVLYPGDPSKKRYIKRVVGLPGERVIVSKGKVSISKNDVTGPLYESYLASDTISEPDGQWELQDEEYFLMGDNRPNSNDSRFFGPVERRFIFGHATLIIWPDFKQTQ